MVLAAYNDSIITRVPTKIRPLSMNTINKKNYSHM